jgi:hypothetical protein
VKKSLGFEAVKLCSCCNLLCRYRTTMEMDVGHVTEAAAAAFASTGQSSSGVDILKEKLLELQVTCGV